MSNDSFATFGTGFSSPLYYNHNYVSQLPDVLRITGFLVEQKEREHGGEQSQSLNSS